MGYGSKRNRFTEESEMKEGNVGTAARRRRPGDAQDKKLTVEKMKGEYVHVCDEVDEEIYLQSTKK